MLWLEDLVGWDVRAPMGLLVLLSEDCSWRKEVEPIEPKVLLLARQFRQQVSERIVPWLDDRLCLDEEGPMKGLHWARLGMKKIDKLVRNRLT